MTNFLVQKGIILFDPTQRYAYHARNAPFYRKEPHAAFLRSHRNNAVGKVTPN